MINLFKKNNKEIEFLKEQISELQSRIKEKNHIIVELTGDRDFWKKEYEELILNTDTTTLEFGKEFKLFYAQKIGEYIKNNIEMEKIKKRIDSDDFYMDKEEYFDLFVKLGEIRQFQLFIDEISKIANKVINK